MSRTLAYRVLTSLAAVLAVAIVTTSMVWAMRIDVSGDQLILAGPVRGDETEKVVRALDENPAITTVILRNSPGGDAPTGYRVGEIFRARGLRTAVSGYCYSSCSRMFLGGTIRVFTDDCPPDDTNVGFHGHYKSDGHLDPNQVRQLGLKDWILKYSDGKADPALVEQWINIEINRGMMHFYHPAMLRGRGGSTFFCQGNEPTRSVFACAVESRSALDLGVITSLDVIASNDQNDLRLEFARWHPKPTGFAAIGDVAKVPLANGAGVREYRRYLTAETTKAFAISPDGKYWVWNSGLFDVVPLVLSRCTASSGQACQLYAVDMDVVWQLSKQ